MGITNANKQIDLARIACDGTLRVTLALAAAPDISSNPTDIALVLDRSGSMSGVPLADMKAGAREFIDIIDAATDGTADGNIGGGSHIAIVSFADTAQANTQMITSVAALKAAVDGLTAGGSTNHADAFETAMGLFDPASSNGKVIVMFTDGKTTAGPDPSPVAAQARAAGIVIYCIGLIGSDGIDVAVLNDWATDPDASHVAVTPDSGDLEELFKDLAANISKPGATDIVIDETVSPDFQILSFSAPTKGTVASTGLRSLQWKMDELGVMGNEGATLEFFVKHVGTGSGVKPVNQSVRYSDAEGNAVTFPMPVVDVECGTMLMPEDCPAPVDFEVEGCRDSLEVDLGDAYLESQGRIVQMNVTVRNVCPHRRVALGIILTEVDQNGTEYPRGMKAVTIPAHSYPGCQDVQVKCIKFVLPEDLNEAGETAGQMCAARNFRARFIAHNIDTDFTCCNFVTGV